VLTCAEMLCFIQITADFNDMVSLKSSLVDAWQAVQPCILERVKRAASEGNNDLKNLIDGITDDYDEGNPLLCSF